MSLAGRSPLSVPQPLPILQSMPVHPVPSRAPRRTVFLVSCAALLLSATALLVR